MGKRNTGFEYALKAYGIGSPYPITETEFDISNIISYKLARTQSMFRYTGLPDTIPQRELEYIIQTAGCCGIAEHDGNLYAFRGSLGGEPDPYNMPTQFIVANPALKFSKSFDIDKDVIIVRNDSMYMGLIPMMSKYATQEHENEVSLLLADIMSRVPALITADDDTTKASAEAYLAKVLKGELGVIATKKFIDSLSLETHPFGSQAHTGSLTDLIEVEQYLKASFWNDIGLNANYNMKRESINATEAQMNGDALLPLVDDMLRNRQEAFDKVNRMFGTSIKVKFASAWEDNEIELEAEQEALTEPETESEEVTDDETSDK